MTAPIASRLRSLAPSATLAMTQRAAELRASGVDVLAFGVGEPDFDTPAYVREAAKRAIDEGVGHYTRVRGVDALRAAIQRDSERRRGHAHSLDEIAVSVGAKHTLYNLALALFEEGDEVLIPAPYWVSYPSQVQLAGATSTFLETREEDGFRVSPAQLEAAIGERTRGLILCTPSNPTGAAYGAEHLRAIADVARDHGDFWIIVDEIYAELTYDGFVQKSLIEVAPELRDRIVVVDGVSKTYAMTGWRIGWMLGPAAVAQAVEKLQGQSTTNPAAVAQYAAAAALDGDRAPIDAMREAFAARRRVVIDGLNAIDGVRCREPEGAFYAFPNVEGLIGRQTASGARLDDDLAVATWLLEDARCALVHGGAFGAPGYLRMSYATSMENIEQGLSRIAAAVATLR